MHTNKGYMIPVILILILLALAGFVIFSQKTVETPSIETPVSEVQNSTSTENILENATSNTSDEDISTTSATTSETSSSTNTEAE